MLKCMRKLQGYKNVTLVYFKCYKKFGAQVRIDNFFINYIYNFKTLNYIITYSMMLETGKFVINSLLHLHLQIILILTMFYFVFCLDPTKKYTSN